MKHSNPESAANARWWFTARLSISLLFIATLMISVEWSRVWAYTRTASASWLAISLIYIPASLVIIALRYRHLIKDQVPFRDMLSLVTFQGAISTFVANAAGSLGFIGILIKAYKVPGELAVQSTIIARLGDMIASLIVALVLVAIAWHRLAAIHSLVLLAIGLSVAVLSLAGAAIVIGRSRKSPPSQDAPGAKDIQASVGQRMRGFCMRVIRLDTGYLASVAPRTLLYSFAFQAVIAIAMYLNARAFNLQIGFFEAALVGVVSSFIASIPITVFGGLGVYEVSTVGLLAVFGVPVEAGAGMILVVRTLFFVAMGIALLLTRPPRQ